MDLLLVSLVKKQNKNLFLSKFQVRKYLFLIDKRNLGYLPLLSLINKEFFFITVMEIQANSFYTSEKMGKPTFASQNCNAECSNYFNFWGKKERKMQHFYQFFTLFRMQFQIGRPMYICTHSKCSDGSVSSKSVFRFWEIP